MHFNSGNSDSGSPLLVQMFTSAACKLLFIAGENAQLMVVTIEKKMFCNLEFALSNSVIVLFVIVSTFVVEGLDNSSSLTGAQVSPTVAQVGHPCFSIFTSVYQGHKRVSSAPSASR